MNKLSQLQKEYDAMKAVAQSSINANVSFDNSFHQELLRLTKLVKSMGGRV